MSGELCVGAPPAKLQAIFKSHDTAIQYRQALIVHDACIGGG